MLTLNTASQLLNDIEELKERLRQAYLCLRDDVKEIDDDWVKRQRENAIQGLEQAKEALTFVPGYIKSIPEGAFPQRCSEFNHVSQAEIQKTISLLAYLLAPLTDKSIIEAKALYLCELLQQNQYWIDLIPAKHPNLINADPDCIEGDAYQVEMYIVQQDGNARSWNDGEYIYLSTQVPERFVRELAIKGLKAELDREATSYVNVGVYNFNPQEIYEEI